MFGCSGLVQPGRCQSHLDGTRWAWVTFTFYLGSRTIIDNNKPRPQYGTIAVSMGPTALRSHIREMRRSAAMETLPFIDEAEQQNHGAAPGLTSALGRSWSGWIPVPEGASVPAGQRKRCQS